MIITKTVYDEENKDWITTCSQYPSISGIGRTPEESREEFNIVLEAIEQEPTNEK